MVHASMRAVGERAEEVVQALLTALGPEGTLMAYVDFEATDDVPAFDLAASPAAREYGVLAEVVRRWPGAVRSTNPGASMAATGSQARWLCADHPLNYGYGPGSPLAKLVSMDGKVLLLGSHFDHVTLLHYAEHVARIPNKRVVQYEVRATTGSVLDIEEFDTSGGVVAEMPEAYFERIVRAFVDGGHARSGRVGHATAYLFEAAKLVSFAVDELERDFA
ncbi:MAG: AAC(3) family N-acetyltransferase, partial [Polyangiaceae bacterium]|nr:AAC(3) family N-acetyltransferase [Polyangiaceae bacterium]